MLSTSAKRLSTLTVAVLGLALSACGSDGGSGNLTFSARGKAAAAPTGTARAALQIADGVQVNRVRMVIRDVKFGLPGVEGEIRVGGPFLIDLQGDDLEGGIKQVFQVTAPAGTYDEIRFVVHKLEDRQNIGDPAIDSRRASIVVDLTDGEGSYQWISQMNEPQRIFGTFVVDEAGGPDNVTLVVDPTNWFRENGQAGGALLNYRSEASRAQIENNIEASLEIFEDDNRDGRNDDGPNHT